MRVVLVTGISGSGKSIAINVLEDDGYFCIDNLPIRFLHEVITSLREAGHEKVAVSVDARSGESVGDLREIASGLGRYGHDVKIIFLNARTDTLVQRYSETRRRHPMALRSGADAAAAPTLVESIERERELMSALEDIGVSLDTSDLHPNVLRSWVRDVVGTERAPLTLLFESFAYKHGVPLDADLVFDVRCLPNPYWKPDLRAHSGLDQPVIDYLAAQADVDEMYHDIHAYLYKWLPRFAASNRAYVTIAIGCTGGHHRSVYLAERLGQTLRAQLKNLQVRHRDLS